MITENLSTLKIHKLTQEQYDRALANGDIDENALYLTPDEEIDLSPYATIEEVSSAYETKVDANDKLTEAQTYTDTIVSGKADINHSHDDDYDKKGSADTALASANAYTDTKVANLTSTTVVDNKISTHNTSTSAHNDIRALITDLTTKLNNFLDVDDATTDQLSEVLTLIENNKGTLESLTTSKVNVSDIIDNLTTASTSKVLSAKQGVAIKTLIDNLQAGLDSHIHAIADVSGLQTALNGKADSSHGTHVSYSTTAPIMDGTASVGTASTVARSDHKHPTDTSRASQADLDALEVVVSGKANATHTHTIANVTNLQSSLDKKQATITGGASSITSSNLTKNRALASDDSGKVVVSDITTTELSYLDGVTSNVQTQLNNKTQRIDLSGQISKSNRTTGVIALCLAPTTTNAVLMSGSTGRLTVQRTNALYAPLVADVSCAAAYGSINRIRARLMRSDGFSKFKFCTFTYEGVSYGGIEVEFSFQPYKVIFDGVTTFDVFALDIYDIKNSTILNEEVYNSLSYDSVTMENTWYDGDYKFITEQNISSQSVNHAASADSATSATKAIQDASGNVIASTYETKVDADTHKADTTKHITATERTNWNAAKTHADSAHAPSNAEKNQNAFSNVKVGNTTISADTTTDTLTLVGTNVTITPDATNDKVTIAVADGTTSVKGVVQLTNSTSSTSTTTAATPNSVKTAYDLANTAKTTADTKANATHKHAVSDITNLTATITELNYVDGVTSNIQTQLDSKADSNHTHSEYISSTNPTFDGTLSMGNSTASGGRSVAFGNSSQAVGHNSFAAGDGVTADGWGSSAFGCGTIAGDYSHAEGYGVIALNNQHAQGHYNDTSKATSGSSSGTTGNAFVIGNGTESAASNAFRVTYAGKPYSKSSLTTTGADYAEFFEWKDLNPDNEDRRGYFVTLDEDKIKIAEPNDYILGIISGQPSVVGNGDEDWMGRYVFDEFGAFIYEDFEYEVEIPEKIQEEVVDEETGETTVVTNTVMKTVKKTGKKYKENPDYDPTRPYIQREDRPEWDYVGLLGVLSVRDDGTCKVNGYCKVADSGMATASETGYRVIKRINDNVVKVIFR